MKVGETYSTLTPQPIVKLADTASFKVRAEVDERDIDKIALHQRVLIQSDTFAGRKFSESYRASARRWGAKRFVPATPQRKATAMF